MTQARRPGPRPGGPHPDRRRRPGGPALDRRRRRGAGGRRATSAAPPAPRPRRAARRRRPPARSGAPAALEDGRRRPGAQLREVPVDDVVPNPKQPRQVFDDEALEELTHSITRVRPAPADRRPRARRTGGYELIMGERRLRAARAAGLDDGPGDRPGHHRRRDAARRAAGEHPPGAAQPAGGGGGLPAAARGVRRHARGAGQHDRPQPLAGHQHHPADEAAGEGADAGSPPACSPPGTPGRCSACRTPRRRTRWPPGSSPRACRCAPPRRRSPWPAAEQPTRQAPARKHQRPGRRGAGRPALRHLRDQGQGPDRPGARAGSSSSSARSTTCSGSSASWPRRSPDAVPRPDRADRRPHGRFRHRRCAGPPALAGGVGPPGEQRGRAPRRARSPAASTAIGNIDVSVSPGETFTSRKWTSPSGVDDRVGAGQVGQPEHLVHPHGQRGRAGGDVVGDPGRRVVLGEARACSARCSRRRRTRGAISTAGSASGPSPRSTTDSASSTPSTNRSTMHRVAVGEAADHRGRAGPRPG